MKNTLIILVATFCFASPAFGQDTSSVVRSAIMASRVPFGGAQITVFDTRGRDRTTNFTASAKFGVDEDELVIITHRGDEITFIANSREFETPAKRVRRGGGSRDLKTSNPSQELPGFGMQFADVLDLLGTRHFSPVLYRDLGNQGLDRGCLLVENTPTSYAYYDRKTILLCDGVVQEVALYNNKRGLIKTIIYDSVERGDGWWRPVRLLIFHGADDAPSITITITYE